jgi:sensor histidine kinase YesM
MLLSKATKKLVINSRNPERLLTLLPNAKEFTYKGRIQAEVKAAQATETAEAESLRRQVVEARMAAMQAQVEPHFLFNTLASIDHLIETDPRLLSIT